MAVAWLVLSVGCAEAPESEDTSLECRLNSDCPVGSRCDEGLCVEDEICRGQSCPCTGDSDCPVGAMCDATSGSCFLAECESDQGCDLGEVCAVGRCLADVEADRDRDGVPDGSMDNPRDNCPEDPNTDQDDGDGDGLGDVCDRDDDDDGLFDTADNCPNVSNLDQHDLDGDGVGNACDEDFKGFAVSGRLTSSLGGVPWAQVAAVSLHADDQRDADVQPDGSFRVSGLSAGTYRMRVEAQGHIAMTSVLQIETGDVTLGELALVPEFERADEAVEMTGRVELSDGATPQDVVVRAKIRGATVGTTLTDEAGVFALPGSREAHTLSFSRSGYQSAEVDVGWDTEREGFTVEGEPLSEQVVARLASDLSASLSGDLTSSIENLVFNDIASITLSGEREHTGVVQANGHFEIGPIRPGLYGLQVEAEGHMPTSRVVTITSGQNNLGEIELTPEFEAPETAALMTGQVVLAGAQRHGNTVVRATVNGVPLATTLTDREGRFSLRVSRLDHTLSFEQPGYLDREILAVWSDQRDRFEHNGLDLASQSLDLVAEPADGIIEVSVDIQPSWIPEAQRHVGLTVFGENFVETRQQVGHNSDGPSAIFTGVPHGTFFIRTEREGFATTQQVVTLSPEDDRQTIALSVTLQSMASARLDLSQISLSAEDFAEGQGLGVDFAFANFQGVSMAGVDLSALEVPLNLDGVDFSNASLAGARLDGVSMLGADFFGANLAAASLIGADMRSANLSSANLHRAVFADSNAPLLDAPCADDAERPRIRLDGVLFAQTDLSGASLRGVDLGGVDLSGARLHDAEMSGACMRESTMVLTDLSGASFDGADLRGASMIGAILRQTSLRGASLDGAMLTSAVIERADFGCPVGGEEGCVGASMAEVNLNGANLVGAHFDGADMRRASMLGVIIGEALHCEGECDEPRRTSFRDADLSESQIVGVIFNRADLSGANLTRAVLDNTTFLDTLFAGADLSYVNLDGVNLLGAALNGVIFANSSLRNGVLAGSDLSEADLSGADLTGADLTEANLERANLSGADITDANLNGAPLTGADLSGLDLRGQNLLERDLTGTNLTEAHFPESNINGMTLTGANLSRAILRGANLSESDFSGANLSGADLGDASLSGATLTGVTWSGTILTRTDLGLADMSGADLRGAVFEATLFGQTQLSEANFEGVDLGGSDLYNALLSDTNFRGADLTGVNLDDSNASGSDFTDANLNGASLYNCSLDGATLVRATFDGAAFLYTTFAGTDLSDADLSGVSIHMTTSEGAIFSDGTICPDGQTQDVLPRCNF